MSRRPALITKAELKRLGRVALETGVVVRIVRPDGTTIEVEPTPQRKDPKKLELL